MKRKCVICAKGLKRLADPRDGPVKSVPWSGAVLHHLAAGYETSQGGGVYYCAVCDGCMAKAVRLGRVTRNQNTMAKANLS